MLTKCVLIFSLGFNTNLLGGTNIGVPDLTYKRMEEFIRVQQELEESINEFKKEVRRNESLSEIEDIFEELERNEKPFSEEIRGVDGSQSSSDAEVDEAERIEIVTHELDTEVLPDLFSSDAPEVTKGNAISVDKEFENEDTKDTISIDEDSLNLSDNKSNDDKETGDRVETDCPPPPPQVNITDSLISAEIGTAEENKIKYAIDNENSFPLPPPPLVVNENTEGYNQNIFTFDSGHLVVEDLESIAEDTSDDIPEEINIEDEGSEDDDEVVMRPNNSPLPSNISLNLSDSRRNSDILDDNLSVSPPKRFLDELKQHQSMKQLNTTGYTSDSDSDRSGTSNEGF